MLVNILNKLYEYSNHYIEVRQDKNLPMPGFSTVEKNIHGQYVPLILINLDLIPNNESVMAHIISHEWGHHVSGHISIVPNEKEMRDDNLRQQKEVEADKYAAEFIKEYFYNLGDIEKFIRQHPIDLENRLSILYSAK